MLAANVASPRAATATSGGSSCAPRVSEAVTFQALPRRRLTARSVGSSCCGECPSPRRNGRLKRVPTPRTHEFLFAFSLSNFSHGLAHVYLYTLYNFLGGAHTGECAALASACNACVESNVIARLDVILIFRQADLAFLSLYHFPHSSRLQKCISTKMSYAKVLAKNAPPEERQAHPDTSLLTTAEDIAHAAPTVAPEDLTAEKAHGKLLQARSRAPSSLPATYGEASEAGPAAGPMQPGRHQPLPAVSPLSARESVLSEQ
jgi:hypothetical protein